MLAKRKKWAFLALFSTAAVLSGSVLELPGLGQATDNADIFSLSGLEIVGGAAFLASSPSFIQTPQEVLKIIPVAVTAYSSSVWETWGDPFITASGSRVRDGIVANNLLAFGTKIRLPGLFGDKVFVVEDRMNSKKGDYHVDVWFSSREEALDFGAKITEMEVLNY